MRRGWLRREFWRGTPEFQRGERKGKPNQEIAYEEESHARVISPKPKAKTQTFNDICDLQY